MTVWATALVQIAAGAAVSLVTGALLLRALPLLQFRQRVYEDAPSTHRSKEGTPTMGGLAILAAIAVAAIFARGPAALALLVLVFGCAAVGALDDYLGIRSGRNAGLRPRTKLLATTLVAVVFVRMAADAGIPDVIARAGGDVLAVPHWLWFLVGIVAVIGTVHAVNLTDGLDGLAAGATIPPLFAAAALALAALESAGAWLPIVTFAIGGCLGFLFYNRFPARMFMGDTGSLALGALLAGSMILAGQTLLLVVVGGLFVAEALSVMLQVAYYKATGGRRIFLMSPLHHHFELAGWREQTVTTRFWLASAICSVLGWAIAHA